MLTTSKYIMHGSSTRCTFCNKPFCFRDGYVELWRTANGEHFCSEFCADDAEEAVRFSNRTRKIPPYVERGSTESSATGVVSCFLRIIGVSEIERWLLRSMF
jgi:hypothetical protein